MATVVAQSDSDGDERHRDEDRRRRRRLTLVPRLPSSIHLEGMSPVTATESTFSTGPKATLVPVTGPIPRFGTKCTI